MDLLRSRAFQPGQMITQKELLELMGMSLGPVRRVLARLETEGFVRILPQHGIRIVEPSLVLFKNITQVRIALEKEAWTRFSLAPLEEKIARYISDHEGFLEECNGRIAQDIIERVSAYDRAMHNSVIHEMQNERLTDIYRISLDTALFLRADKGYVRPYTIRNTLHEHLEILSAAERQDILALQEAVEKHIMGAVHRFVL
jgi:DNA-binding GntR family transcriptional regulator